MSDEKRAAETKRLHERATEEIRVLLARRRMSAAELARRTGQKPAALSRRMTGDVPFDLDDLEVIARELGVSVLDLLKTPRGDDVQTTAPYSKSAGSTTRQGAERLIPRQTSGRHDAVTPDPATRRPIRLDGNAQPRTHPTGAAAVAA